MESVQPPANAPTADGYENSAHGPNLRDFAAISRDSIFIVAVLLYFVGFSYYYSYVSRFGIVVSLRDVPIYQLFVYAYAAISGYYILFYVLTAAVMSVLIIGGAYLAFIKLPKQERTRENALAAMYVGVGMALITFYIFGFLAAHRGSKDADSMRAASVVGCARVGESTFAMPTVFRFASTAERRIPSRILKANSDGRLQLIYETPETYYLLIHECAPMPGRSALDATSVFAVAKLDVVFYGIELPQ